MSELDEAATTADEMPRRSSGLAWAALGLAAVLAVMIAIALAMPDRARVLVVGAGAISELRDEDAPEGFAYRLDVRAHEPVDRTYARVTDAIGSWPDIIVIGVDPRELTGGPQAEQRTRQTLARLTRQAENATAVPVLLGFVAPADADDALRAAVERSAQWWRLELCRQPGLRICVDAGAAPSSARLREAVAAAVREASERHDELVASTQQGR